MASTFLFVEPLRTYDQLIHVEPVQLVGFNAGALTTLPQFAIYTRTPCPTSTPSS
jgi:hypothetical protein